MLLSPLICGRWDGCHLWAQWNRVEGATSLFEWRWRGVPAGEWSAWQAVSREGGLRRAWLALPLWREGAQVQARVALAGDGAPEWEPAQEVTFLKSRCRFLVSAQGRGLVMPRDTEWHAVVDGAPCSYRMEGEALDLPAGTEKEVWAVALGATGFAQLDHPGHFKVCPELGLTIRNCAPSEADVDPTGRDLTVMEPLPPGPLRIVFDRPYVR